MLEYTSRSRRWLKRLGLAAAVLFMAMAGWFTWMINRPQTCSIEAAGATGVRIDEQGVLGNFYPAAKRRSPAILVIGGSEGGLSREAKREAVALQTAGFTTLQIAYHCAPGLPNGIARIPLETFGQALNWMKRRPEVDPSAVGVVGYSKGAEAALLVASRHPDVRAVAVGMPSSVSWDAAGIMAMIFKGARSSWTYRGVDVPSLPYGSMKSDRGDTYGLHANGLVAIERHPAAVIAVDQIAGPILIACGDKDEVWPACPMAAQISRRREARGRSRPTILRYPDGGHGVFGVPYPSNDRGARYWGAMGGTVNSNTEARRDGWPEVVTFLRRALAVRPANRAGASVRSRALINEATDDRRHAARRDLGEAG